MLGDLQDPIDAVGRVEGTAPAVASSGSTARARSTCPRRGPSSSDIAQPVVTAMIGPRWSPSSISPVKPASGIAALWK